jgi:hypothetical protein
MEVGALVTYTGPDVCVLLLPAVGFDDRNEVVGVMFGVENSAMSCGGPTLRVALPDGNMRSFATP